MSETRRQKKINKKLELVSKYYDHECTDILERNDLQTFLHLFIYSFYM